MEAAPANNVSKEMHYSKQFRIKPGRKIRASQLDPAFTDGKKKSALAETKQLQKRIRELQYKLYAEARHSLLICLQAPDAGGKDGVIRHVFAAMNPQGCRVVSFKQPSREELAHDFLWRAERNTPRRGEVVIFNRSYYEDVLVVRVHNLVPKKVWLKRYEYINQFERRLLGNDTRILKFFLHISSKEQLKRFKERLDNPARHWKISETDYTEREHWNDYVAAYEDGINKCNSDDAPWFVIPSDHKWFRNLVISRIIVETMEQLRMKLPAPTVDIAAVRKKYHEAAKRQ